MTNQPEAGTKEAQAQTPATRPSARVFPSLFEDMDRFWEPFMTAPWRGFGALGRRRAMPALDVFEKDGKLHVEAELPGIEAKDVQIEISDDVLTISGEKKDEREVKEDNYVRSERSYGSFRRQVALPAGADTDNAEASFKDGVLRVAIPVKAAAAAKKTIQVKAG